MGLLQTNMQHVSAATQNKNEACVDMETLAAAETTCTALHDCGALEDTNFGSDCTDTSGDSASGVPTATMAPSSSSRRSFAFATTITLVLTVAAGPYLL